PRSTTRPPGRSRRGCLAAICSSLKMLRASKPLALACSAYLSRPLYGLLTAGSLDAVPGEVEAGAVERGERDELPGAQPELLAQCRQLLALGVAPELVGLGGQNQARDLGHGQPVQELTVGLLRVASDVHKQHHQP